MKMNLSRPQFNLKPNVFFNESKRLKTSNLKDLPYMDIRSQLVGYVGALHEPAGPKDHRSNRIQKKNIMKHNKPPKACKLRWAPWQTEKEIGVYLSLNGYSSERQCCI